MRHDSSSMTRSITGRPHASPTISSTTSSPDLRTTSLPNDTATTTTASTIHAATSTVAPVFVGVHKTRPSLQKPDEMVMVYLMGVTAFIMIFFVCLGMVLSAVNRLNEAAAIDSSRQRRTRRRRRSFDLPPSYTQAQRLDDVLPTYSEACLKCSPRSRAAAAGGTGEAVSMRRNGRASNGSYFSLRDDGTAGQPSTSSSHYCSAVSLLLPPSDELANQSLSVVRQVEPPSEQRHTTHLTVGERVLVHSSMPQLVFSSCVSANADAAGQSHSASSSNIPRPHSKTTPVFTIGNC